MKIHENCPKMLDSFTSDTMLKDEVYVLYLQFIDTAMSIYMMLDVFTTRYKLGMRMGLYTDEVQCDTSHKYTMGGAHGLPLLLCIVSGDTWDCHWVMSDGNQCEVLITGYVN